MPWPRLWRAERRVSIHRHAAVTLHADDMMGRKPLAILERADLELDRLAAIGPRAKQELQQGRGSIVRSAQGGSHHGLPENLPPGGAPVQIAVTEAAAIAISADLFERNQGLDIDVIPVLSGSRWWASKV